MKKTIFLSVVIIFITLSLFAQKTYRVGDVYNENGIKGIVYKVTDGGQHGMIMSLKCAGKDNNKWCSDKKLFTATRAFSETDGMQNTQAIYDYCEQNGKNLSVFPIFSWCKSLGDGWYIPSLDEMKELACALFIKGGFEDKCDIDHLNSLNDKITKAGGESLVHMSVFNMWACSTENDNGTINFMVFVDLGKKFKVGPAKKGFNVRGTRAVRVF